MLKFFLIFISIILLNLFTTSKAAALICLPIVNYSYIAICKNSVCDKGFRVEKGPTGPTDSFCQAPTRVTVIDQPQGLNELYSKVLNYRNLQNVSGIYNIKYDLSPAFYVGYKNFQIEAMPIEHVTFSKLSDSTSEFELEKYKILSKFEDIKYIINTPLGGLLIGAFCLLALLLILARIIRKPQNVFKKRLIQEIKSKNKKNL